MKDFAMKMTKKAKSGIDSAGSFLSDLPIIGDYQNKERRRDADRKLRESIAVSLETARKRIIEIERLLLRKGKLTDLPYVDVAANRLQTLIDRIHTAPSGYAGFFDREAIREPELEKLHQFDERIAASVPEINEKINTMEQCINAGEDYSQALTDLINSLDDLSERMDQRKEAIRSAGEEVAAIAEISETPPSGTPTTPPDDSFVD
jgi:DNA repair exonuclease SbcCD ATPase subunit